jgi:lipopolysaccharide export system protein LptC
MSDRRRLLDARRIALGLILLLAAVLSWWLSRETAPPPGTPDAKRRHDPDYFVEKFSATAMDERGAPKYVLAADRLTHYPDDDTTHYVKPVLDQYKPNGAHTKAWSDTGVMPGNASEIVMDGNVHVTNAGDPRSAGGEITTPHLRVELDK